MSTINSIVIYPDHTRHVYLWNDLSNRNDFMQLIQDKLLKNLSDVDYTNSDSKVTRLFNKETGISANWIEFDSSLKTLFNVSWSGHKPYITKSLVLKPITGACHTFDMPTKCPYYNGKGCHFCESPLMTQWRKTMKDFSL